MPLDAFKGGAEGDKTNAHGPSLGMGADFRAEKIGISREGGVWSKNANYSPGIEGE